MFSDILKNGLLFENLWRNCEKTSKKLRETFEGILKEFGKLSGRIWETLLMEYFEEIAGNFKEMLILQTDFVYVFGIFKN